MAARGLRTTVPVATGSRLCSYSGRTNGPNPLAMDGTDIIDGTRLPRCSTGPPICLMCTPSRDRCRASRGSVSTNSVSMPWRCAWQIMPKYNPTGT